MYSVFTGNRVVGFANKKKGAAGLVAVRSPKFPSWGGLCQTHRKSMFQIPVREAESPSEAEKLIFSSSNSCHLPSNWSLSPLLFRKRRRRNMPSICVLSSAFISSPSPSPPVWSLWSQEHLLLLRPELTVWLCDLCIRRLLLPPAAELLLRRRLLLWVQRFHSEFIKSSARRRERERESPQQKK